MTSALRRAFALALALCALVGSLQAEPAAGPVPVPPLQGFVTDLTGTLSPAQQAALEARLQAFSERKGAQVAVLVVPSTGPEPIEAYGLRVVEQWKLGRRKVDDGALLLVAKDDHALRIEVGYGLEGALPDAVAKRIVSEVIAPRFRQGDFYGGLDAGTDQILRIVDGEALPAADLREAPAPGVGRLLPVFIVLALALGGALRAALGRLPGATVAGLVVGGLAWALSGALAVAAIGALVAFFFTLIGAGLRGGPFVMGGGRGGFGGGGGGGFGGGGGGSFGGGGASGRW